MAHGQVRTNPNVNGSANWVIPGGVLWVEGSFTQNGSLTYQGCIIATGNIRLKGSVNQTKVGRLPAIVGGDVAVRVNGAHTINGLVYSARDITWNGAGHIYGSILCGGNLTFHGAYGNIYYNYWERRPTTAAEVAGVRLWATTSSSRHGSSRGCRGGRQGRESAWLAGGGCHRRQSLSEERRFPFPRCSKN